MKIGIIVYSQTGHTLGVSEKLKTALDKAGHQAAVDKVEISGEPHRGASAFTVSKAPDASLYDAVIFASPVQAFSLAVPMKKYMQELPDLTGKKTLCFVTKQLPFKWTGGRHALSEMSSFCTAAGAKPVGTDLVIWSSSQLEADIDAAVQRLANNFPAV